MQELLERKKGLYRTILIVDDEMIEREMLGAMLSDQYHILYAEILCIWDLCCFILVCVVL